MDMKNVPLCKTKIGTCAPEPDTKFVDIPLDKLPNKDNKLLRPAVVWFGEGLDDRVTPKTHTICYFGDINTLLSH